MTEAAWIRELSKAMGHSALIEALALSKERPWVLPKANARKDKTRITIRITKR
jgi:hypothetical protein